LRITNLHQTNICSKKYVYSAGSNEYKFLTDTLLFRRGVMIPLILLFTMYVS